MKDRHSKWMALSGTLGFVFFLIANFTSIFQGLNVLAGVLQLCINAIVFGAWGKAFLDRTGFSKLFAFFGVAVPLAMASVTIYRVLIPPILGWLYY